MLAKSAESQSLVKADQGRPGNQGAWPVAVTGSADGGAYATVYTTPAKCAAGDGGFSYHKTTSVGVASGATPSAQTAGRQYITLCNSLQNAGNPMVKCRIDGTTPVMAVANAGDVLGIGDCIVYPIATAITPLCIADTASTNVTSFECIPQP